MTWADAHLTEKGIQQASAMKAFWQDAAATLKLPLPRRHYVSPHVRCLETCQLAFSGLSLPDDGGVPPFQPVIKEMLRERMGVHTCDRRRARSWIHTNHPNFTIEDGFSEMDELWKPDIRETLAEHVVRVRVFLDELFAAESETIISLTIHSGTILALFAAIGHAEVRVAPGTIVPVLIKATITDT